MLKRKKNLQSRLAVVKTCITQNLSNMCLNIRHQICSSTSKGRKICIYSIIQHKYMVISMHLLYFRKLPVYDKDYLCSFSLVLYVCFFLDRENSIFTLHTTVRISNIVLFDLIITFQKPMFNIFFECTHHQNRT